MNDRITQNIHSIHDTLTALSGQAPVKAVLLSRKREHFGMRDIGRFSAQGIEFDVLPDIDAVRRAGITYDICILCGHNLEEEPLLFALRSAGLARLYCLWLWDNHHHHVLNLRTALLADILFVSHWHERHYLNHPAILPGPHMPACAHQWSVAAGGLPANRSDGLFGGFVRYRWSERNGFIEALMAACPGHALTLGPIEAYMAKDENARLAEWAGHKAQLLVPIAQDLSTRCFDALMTGQIPLVPTDVADLDLVVPPAVQAALPILRYAPGSVESALAAWREAVRRFDAEGAAGVARRHQFARDRHSLTSRLERFAGFFRQPGQFSLAADRNYQFWESWADRPGAS